MAAARRARVVRTDSFDDACFRRTTEGSGAFERTVAAGARLYPHFPALCHDLFAALFKLHVEVAPPSAVLATARLSRWVVTTLLGSGGYPELHERTRLDEVAAARATLRIAGVLLRGLRSEELLSRDEMVRLHGLDQLRDRIAERRDELASAEELAERADGERRSALEEAAEELREDLDALEDAAGRAEEEADAMIEGIPSSLEEALRGESDGLPQRLDEQDATLRDFGEQVGAPGETPAHEKLELGEQLLDNRKLQLLAKMVGVFREFALGERRRRPIRRAIEVTDVERGADLGHVLPSELVALRHPTLGRLFRRALLERSLLQVKVATEGEAGRGPVVVCLDVSSSMQGPREMWAKAVTLTLLELARRQRRAFQVLCFSAGRGAVTAFDLLTGGRAPTRRSPVSQADLVRFASFFPGGGTDYEQPLSRALETIRGSGRRRADVVFVTDGEAQLDPGWLAAFLEEKRRLDFKVFTVLIDLQGEQTAAVRQFSDRITSVSKLTVDEGRDLFLAL